jgi:hypothetical protein
MFTWIGFLHFVSGHENPIGTLDAELQKNTTPRGSLIVLPEAFNLGRPYSEKGKAIVSRDKLLRELTTRSALYDARFVVGVLEPEVSTGQNPHSSAYFVDASEHRLMCHKENPDFIGEYTTCPVAPDHENPLVAGESSIHSVICVDIQNTGRCSRLAKSAMAQRRRCNITCIPAVMCSQFFQGGILGEKIQLGYSDDHYVGHIVLANSCETGTRSFITGANGVVTYGGPHCQDHFLPAIS